MSAILRVLDQIEESLREMERMIYKKNYGRIKIELAKINASYSSLSILAPQETTKEPFLDFQRHLHFIEIFSAKKDIEWIKSNFEDIRKKDFPEIRLIVYDSLEKNEGPPYKKILSKNIFIVHGRDHKPMKELKTLLIDLGLNPIVLHEQASGGLTLAEKLEKYGRNIGYAFVILTPEDVGGHREEIRNKYKVDSLRRTVAVIGTRVIDEILEDFEPRARQNVIFEMGYFWGLLERKKVCCLLKGNVDKPSDIEGLVYVPFNDSISEAKGMILKELREAGYDIKV